MCQVTAVKQNPIIVVMGETGSGKTTQVAQYLADSGMAQDGLKIAISQPRRVGAMAAAERVAEERGVKVGEEVNTVLRRACAAYSVRDGRRLVTQLGLRTTLVTRPESSF